MLLRTFAPLPRMLLYILVLLPSCRGAVPIDPTVLLISFDGFRWDYLEMAETPNLDRLARAGVRAEGLIPVFPSKTFPNHYSIVTGLYAESHGIVGNRMFDEQLGHFRLSDREAVGNEAWWGGEPIWTTAARQGKKSATLFWPGSEAEIRGHRPTYWQKFDSEMSYRERLRQILEWLELPAQERPVFICTYFAIADSAGHDFGPNSSQLKEAVRALDRTVGRLMDGLRSKGLADAVNLILVSDHGMTPLSPERVIFLDDYLDLKDIEVVEWSPVLLIRPRRAGPGPTFRALAKAHPHLTVYLKHQIPERLHFKNHHRITPVVGIADEGWTITSRPRFNRRQGRLPAATHGYDNRLKSMQGVFIAHGPAFQQGLRVPPFLSIHVYALMTHILRLEPAASEADLEVVRSMLVDH